MMHLKRSTLLAEWFLNREVDRHDFSGKANVNCSNLSFLVTAGILAHNMEEIIFFPKSAAESTRWPIVVKAREFRFAAVFLSLLLVSLNGWLCTSPPHSVALNIYSGFVATMMFNALFPHALWTTTQRSYMPGTATGVAFVLPLGGLFLYRSIAEGLLDTKTLLWVAPVAGVTLLASLPVLFATARILFR